MPEELIKQKKEKLLEEIVKQCPDFLRKSELGDLGLVKNRPDDMIEYELWAELEREYYWRSFEALIELSKRGKINRFSEQELSQITNMIIQQIKEGKKIAGSIPAYSDIFDLIGKDESPLKKYVSAELIEWAVNTGFWESMRQSNEKIKNHSCCMQVSRILCYDSFFRYFDFKKGAEKADEMPLEICLENKNFNDWFMYMRWYLVQEISIEKKFGYEKGAEIRGKLAAPLVNHPLNSHESDEPLKLLANVFLNDTKLIRSKPIQKVLGELYEINLEHVLTYRNDDYYSEHLIEQCRRCLLEPDRHTKAVWEKVKGKADLSRLQGNIREYLPKEAYGGYADKLKGEIESMQRFDFGVFSRWMRLRISTDVSKEVYSRTRNRAMEIYFNQRARPKKDIASAIYSMMNSKMDFGSGYMPDRINGYLFSDLASKGEWSMANNILMHYRDNATQRHKAEFFNAIVEYSKKHGKIKIAEKSIDKKACYPSYNLIAEVCQRNPHIFEIKK